MTFYRFMTFMFIANAGRTDSTLLIPCRPDNISAARWRAMLRHFAAQGYEARIPIASQERTL